MRKLELEDKTCLGCNSPFNRRVLNNGKVESVANFSRRRFCSQKCDPTKIYFEDRTCLQCRVHFGRNIRPSGKVEHWFNYRKRKFCSRKCYDLFGHHLGPQPPKVVLEDKICLQCKISFNRKRNVNDKIEGPRRFQARKFCSGECAVLYNRGTNHYEYKTGTTIRSDGYIVRNSSNRGKKLLHREAMEKYLGRSLKSSEIVHHCDGRPDNNFISNLEILSRSEHARLHGKLRANTLKFSNGRFCK